METFLSEQPGPRLRPFSSITQEMKAVKKITIEFDDDDAEEILEIIRRLLERAEELTRRDEELLAGNEDQWDEELD